ncbi:Tetratricopeptide TPR_2 repeat-containing protein [Desulfovibrio sp. X2]|uniref:tetratricopeptide repeat protein n=1 Tax=Desulfovibrio sp. X2 TaxID=941449 RepID=UPI000358EB47|nr:tetratricopeptide repeat protein [Desulfovibrio sp. X2]EPR42297.1 Tetratricopeptide TPR_2 repeat-containing protein [Desulfovibrio sp. X2]
MTSWSWLKELFGETNDEGAGLPSDMEGYAPPSRDTLAAIGELSRAVKNNPDAIELYLALGNLYRAQGELERAVQIRTNLIERHDIPRDITAKVLYELGRDYKRAGFLDRALNALEKARELAGNEPPILVELARLAAEAGEFEAAADLYGKIGHAPAQAHYLVRQAVELLGKEQATEGLRLIDRALEVHPGSPEAWVETVILDLQAGFPEGSEQHIARALHEVAPELRFLVLELMLGYLSRGTPGHESPEARATLAGRLLSPLEAHAPDVLLQFYGGLLRQALGDHEGAAIWFERSLLLNPDFWPARLEMLARALAEEPVSPMLSEQLQYFVARAREVKRFMCRACGLKRERVFYLCPRCQSWHSIGYRMRLTE